jgi:hypothetical protein
MGTPVPGCVGGLRLRAGAGARARRTPLPLKHPLFGAAIGVSQARRDLALLPAGCVMRFQCPRASAACHRVYPHVVRVRRD